MPIPGSIYCWIFSLTLLGSISIGHTFQNSQAFSSTLVELYIKDNRETNPDSCAVFKIAEPSVTTVSSLYTRFSFGTYLHYTNAVISLTYTFRENLFRELSYFRINYLHKRLPLHPSKEAAMMA